MVMPCHGCGYGLARSQNQPNPTLSHMLTAIRANGCTLPRPWTTRDGEVKDDGANNVREYVESFLGWTCQGNPSYYSRKPVSKPSKTLFIKTHHIFKTCTKVLKTRGNLNNINLQTIAFLPQGKRVFV